MSDTGASDVSACLAQVDEQLLLSFCGQAPRHCSPPRPAPKPAPNRAVFDHADLPVEVHHLVFGFLDGQSLARAAQVCRRCAAVSLFKSLCWRV